MFSEDWAESVTLHMEHNPMKSYCTHHLGQKSTNQEGKNCAMKEKFLKKVLYDWRNNNILYKFNLVLHFRETQTHFKFY